MKFFSQLQLKTTVSILVCGVVILAMLVTHILIGYNVSKNTMISLENKAMNIARTVAYSPAIIEAMSGIRPEEEIQDYTKKVQAETDVNYVVVFDMAGIRKSHPEEEKIGLPFVGGDEDKVLKGDEAISIAEGTLGKSLRAFSPIFSQTGDQLGAVAVGISLDKVHDAVAQSRSIIYIGILFGTMIGLIGAILLANRIKRILFGLEPSEIARVYEERNGMIQSMFEGVIAIDEHALITLANSKAKEFFTQAGIEGDLLGNPVDEYIPSLQLSRIVKTGKVVRNQEFEINGIPFLVNSSPLFVKSQIVGAIVTFRDKTEIKILAEQLTGVRMYADTLRAQTHEFMNKLHVILGMVHMKYYDEIPPYVSQLKNHFQEEIGFVSNRIKDPVFAGFILGKMSEAREKGILLKISEDSVVLEPQNKEYSHEFVTIIGNLLDNAFDSVEESDEKLVFVQLSYSEDHQQLTIIVSDTGQGMNTSVKNNIFEKGFSTKKEGRGYGLYLLKQTLDKLEGQLELDSEAGRGTTFKIVLPYKSKDV